MPTLKAYHYYVNIRKNSSHIKEIMPMSDIEVSDNFFSEYEDRSKNKDKSKIDCIEDE